MGLLVAMLVVNGILQSSKGEDEYMLVQMGMGAEEENDKMLINALGAEDGDTTKEVEEMTEEEVLAAEEATQEGVDEEINNALADAESAAKGAELPALNILSVYMSQRSISSHFSPTTIHLHHLLHPLLRCPLCGSSFFPFPPLSLLLLRLLPLPSVLSLLHMVKISFDCSFPVTYESDIEKYKSQEAGMGHSGWVQSWARARRSVGLAQPVRRAEMQQLAMAQRRTRRARSSSVPIPL